MNKPLIEQPPSAADQNSQDFIRFALNTGVLKFGEFKTKAGRLSPYFFNAGLFNDGASLGQLAGFYAERILAAQQSSELEFDVLFGPAYKGITLASATVVCIRRSHSIEKKRKTMVKVVLWLEPNLKAAC
jgi:orotate phosphoribosyltransferase